MNMPRRGIFLALILLLAAGAPLAAQVRVELGFGWTFVAPAFNASYASAFSPPMTGGEYTSSAAQTVHVKGKISYGLAGFLNVFVGQNFGVQVLADYFRPSLGGTNSDYTVTLDYETFGPRTYTKTGAWPSTRGDFAETTYSLNGIVRFPLADNVSLSFSGGGTSFYLKGKAAPIGFWSFDLEQPDPSTYQLVAKSYQLVYNFGPQTKWGFNIGGEVAYTITRAVIISLDLRRYQCAKRDFPMQLAADQGITDPIEPIEAVLDLGSLRIDPSYFRACVTLRFVF
jgi:hypothetical protein